MSTTGRANYGLDAPGVVRTMASVGGAALLGCTLMTTVGRLHRLAGLGSAMCWMGASLVSTALLMIASSRWGKLRARDALLDRLALCGTETLLVERVRFSPWIFPPTRELVATRGVSPG